jgi:RNA polymerase sigma factor (sigma-70 family)
MPATLTETNSSAKDSNGSRKADSPIPFIKNDQFHDTDPKTILSLPPGTSIYGDREDLGLVEIDACGDFDMLHDMPLLSPEGESFLFRKMNYLKFLAEQSRTTKRADASKVASLLEDAEAVRNHIAECNMRLVISLARKFSTGAADFDELMSEGSEILLKAISKFDFGRGFRFSTYATHSIQRHFFRYTQRRQKRKTVEVKTPIELLNELPEAESDSVIAEWVREEERMSQLISRMAECLDERECTIVAGRFGLGKSATRTLRELAADLGLSKERVRQLQMAAIEKLRGLFDELDGDLVGA